MSDRFKDLPEREQRIAMMRRGGEDFRDENGEWTVELGDGPESALVRTIWDDDDEPGDADATSGDEGPAE